MKYELRYRAPSGFASTDRKHVEEHIKNLRWRASGKRVCMSDAIEELSVPARTLLDLTVDCPSVSPVHLLQVDVEGVDDDLVLAAVDCDIFPNITNFEVCHLGSSRLAVVRSKLEANGYRLTLTGADLLAIRTTQAGTAKAQQFGP